METEIFQYICQFPVTISHAPETDSVEETKHTPRPHCFGPAEYFQDNYCLHNINEIPLFKFIVP